MTFLRSLLFTIFMVITMPLTVLGLLLVFWLPTRSRRLFVMPWIRLVMWMIRHLLHIEQRLLGVENLPATPCVVLCKHQSTWETFALQILFPLSSFVYKKELHWLPFFGLGLMLVPFVAIDRGAGKAALKQVAERGKQRLDEGYTVIIFPEGTRVAPGEHRRYKIGGAHLAARAGVPIIPIAHNAGELWGRQKFLRHPGTVTISIGPAIYPEGKTDAELNAAAENWIETEMRRISPHRYKHAIKGSPADTAA